MNLLFMADTFHTALYDLQHQPLARLSSVADIKQKLPIPTYETSQRYLCMLRALARVNRAIICADTDSICRSRQSKLKIGSW
jgi:hypothetical protein